MTTMKENGLAKLCEELGELQQIVGKLIQFPELQHDRQQLHPSGYNLLDCLENEMADVKAAITYVSLTLELYTAEIDSRESQKLQAFIAWGNEMNGNGDTPVRASTAEVVLPNTAEPTAIPVPQWRCFHCDEVFTDREAAADHFGVQIDGCADDVACKLNATDGLLVKMLREAQEELRQYRQEDNAAYRQFYALGADHAAALRREEEKGYARGLKDAGFSEKTKTNE